MLQHYLIRGRGNQLVASLQQQQVRHMGVLDNEVLRQSNHHDGLTGGQFRQPVRGQFTANICQHRHRDQRGVHQRLGQCHIAALLCQQHEIQRVHAEATVLLRHRDSGEAQLGQLLPQGPVTASVRLPACADALGCHLVHQKIAHRFLEQ